MSEAAKKSCVPHQKLFAGGGLFNRAAEGHFEGYHLVAWVGADCDTQSSHLKLEASSPIRSYCQST